MPHIYGLTEGAGIEREGNVTGMVNNKGARKGMQDWQILIYIKDIILHDLSVIHKGKGLS